MADQSGATADLRALSDALDDAYWAASTIEGKDTIRGVEKLVNDAIIAADAKAIADRTAAFKQVAKDVTALNGALRDLQTQINDIVKNVEKAAQVVAAISKILPLLI